MSEEEPAWLDATAVAKRICVRESQLSRLVKLGRVPKPNYTLGPRSPRWDRAELDAQFNIAVKSSDHRNRVRPTYDENSFSKNPTRRTSH
jgi:predicted DNA-binding transcriptional regulator AlpA